jgi:uncharacterized protein YecT (DUF1311 family)
MRRTLLLGRAFAIDNPESPDLTAAFLARAQPFEERLDAGAGGGGEARSRAAGEYASFLEIELDRAYMQLQLQLQLDAAGRRSLQVAQRRWLDFRGAEERFIADNWIPRNFGSSSLLSRGGYRARLVKERVLTLLAYLQNYPETPR